MDRENNTCFFSLIVPVYNVETYLSECLDSLGNQNIDFDAYEIICVNDGSKDGSSTVLENYASVYPNMRVIHKENGGVTTARNVGLQTACGKYIWYIDADDFIQKNCLSELMAYLQKEDCDRLIVGNYSFVHGQPIEAATLKKNTGWYDSVVWRNLFRREYLLKHNLLFHYEELIFGEDALYMYEIKRFDPRTKQIFSPLYYHRERPGSACTDESHEQSIRKLDSNLREAEIMKGYYENGNVLPVETANRFMLFLQGSMFRLAQMPLQEAVPYLGKLKNKGLYPYRRPKECTITKSYQTTRTDFIGVLFDKIYINVQTRWGFWLMRGWLLAGKLKRLVRAKK